MGIQTFPIPTSDLKDINGKKYQPRMYSDIELAGKGTFTYTNADNIKANGDFFYVMDTSILRKYSKETFLLVASSASMSTIRDYFFDGDHIFVLSTNTERRVTKILISTMATVETGYTFPSSSLVFSFCHNSTHIFVAYNNGGMNFTIAKIAKSSLAASVATVTINVTGSDSVDAVFLVCDETHIWYTGRVGAGGSALRDIVRYTVNLASVNSVVISTGGNTTLNASNFVKDGTYIFNRRGNNTLHRVNLDLTGATSIVVEYSHINCLFLYEGLLYLAGYDTGFTNLNALIAMNPATFAVVKRSSLEPRYTTFSSFFIDNAGTWAMDTGADIPYHFIEGLRVGLYQEVT
jgi:hypothetical protein